MQWGCEAPVMSGCRRYRLTAPSPPFQGGESRDPLLKGGERSAHLREGKSGVVKCGRPRPSGASGIRGLGCLLLKRRRPPRGAPSRESVLEGAFNPWEGASPDCSPIPSSLQAPGAQSLREILASRDRRSGHLDSGHKDIGEACNGLDLRRRFNTSRQSRSATGAQHIS